MKPNNEKGGNKSMYKKSKRFLAGFLALLLAVTMLPTDMLSVVYAEEDESVAAEVDTEADDDVEEAEVLENAEPNDDAEEVLVEEDDLKDDPTEPASSEPGTTPSEPGTEPVEPGTTPSEPGTTPVEPGTEPVEPGTEPTQPTEPDEEVNDWELNISDLEVDTYSAGTFLNGTIFKANTSLTVTTTNKYYESADKTERIDFDKRITLAKFNKTAQSQIVFTPKKSGLFKICALTGSTGKDRLIELTGGNVNTTFSTIDDSTQFFGNVRYATQRVEANVEYTLTYIDTSGGSYLYYIAVAYDEDPLSFNNTQVSVKVMDKDNATVTSPKYTGEPYKFDLTVTDENGKIVKDTRYKVTYKRDNEETTDLTSAGTIQIVLTPSEGSTMTDSKTVSVTIDKADLEVGNKTINIDPDTTETAGEYDITAHVFADTPGADTLNYELDTTVDGYTAGNVISNPAISNDKKLTYTIEKPQTPESTVLGVKVTSDNYNDKTFTITVNMKDKVAVTVSLASKTHVYNGGVFGFRENVEITDVTGEGVTLQDAEQDLKDNLSYKYQAEGSEPTAEEPTQAGVYTVIAELADSSAYTLSSNETGATLTITARPIKLQAKDVEWDKILDSVPVSKKASSSDYTFVEATEGEENPGLVSGDTITTQPTIKYYKNYTDATSAEMTSEDWKTLRNSDTVDIILSEADAGKNYEIAYEKGTLTTLVRTVVAPTSIVPEAGATLVPSNMTSVTSSKTSVFSTDGCFVFTADESNTVTVDGTTRLKTDGTGTPFYRSIGFQISKAAKVEVTCTSANSSSVRPVLLGRVNDDGTITEITIGSANKNNSATLTQTIEEAGIYFIYSKGYTEGSAGGINITQVKVSYDGVVITPKVSVTPTISDADAAMLDGATVYFTATGEADAAVTSGTVLELKQGVSYTLVVKKDNTVVNNLTAKINGETTYTPSTDESVTITIEEKSDPTPGETVTITPTISAEDQAKLGNAQVVFVKKGEGVITVTSGQPVTLDKGVEYVLNVVNVPEGVVFTAKINGETTYTPSADADVTITIDKKEASNIATPVANPAGGTELPTAGGSVTLTCATTGAKIYYTTDGSDPADAENTARKEYTEAIEIKTETTIRAVAVVGDDVSDELEAHYTILPEGGIPMPVADKLSGKVDFGTTVTLTCSDPEAKIYYAINGTEPTLNSNEYTGPITITESIVIKAIAIKGDKSSAVATFEYEVEEAEEPGPVEKTIQLKDCVITVPSILEGSKTGVVTYVTYKDPETKKTVKFTEGIDYTVAAKEGATNTLVLTGAERDPYDGRSVDGYTISKENPVEKTYSVITKVNAKNKSQYIDVSKAKITLNKTETKGLYYTGYAQEPSLDFSKDAEYKALYDAGRLNIAYRNNINAGTATVIISVIPDEIAADTPSTAAIEAYDAEGSTEPGSEAPPAADTSKVYYGAKTLTFSIKKAALNKNNAKATAEARVVLPTDLNYLGDAITADSIQVITKPAEGTGLQLKLGRDYTVTYKNNQKAGKATITLKGTGNNLSGSYAATYTIGALDMSGWSFDMTEGMLENAFVYSPKGARLTWMQLSKGEGDSKQTVVLEEGVDYTAKYTYADKKDKKAGTKATVVIKGKNGCKGTVTVPELTIAKADFAKCIKLTGKKGLYDGYNTFYVDKDSKKDVLTDLKKTVIVTDNAGVKLSLDKDYVIEKVTPEANAPENAKDQYVVKASTAAKENYKEKTEEDPSVNDEVNIPYIVAANLAKDKSFLMSKTLEKTDPLGYDGRNPVEITQDALDKYINGLDITQEIQNKDRKYLLDTEYVWGNIGIVEGSYKNNAKKGTAQVTITGTGWSDENHTAYYGTKVLKFKIVDK